MRLLYKPFSIIAGLIAAKLGQSIFNQLWSRIDTAEPPKPTTEEASLPKVVGAAALEAATLAGIGALVDRASARAFQHLTGVWPAKKSEKSED